MAIDARAARTPAKAMGATATASRPIPAVDESFAAATPNAIATRIAEDPYRGPPDRRGDHQRRHGRQSVERAGGVAVPERSSERRAADRRPHQDHHGDGADHDGGRHERAMDVAQRPPDRQRGGRRQQQQHERPRAPAVPAGEHGGAHIEEEQEPPDGVDDRPRPAAEGAHTSMASDVDGTGLRRRWATGGIESRTRNSG